MNLSHLAGAAALLLVASCTTQSMERDHWHINSVGPRIGYHFLGYQPAEDGSYWNRLSTDGSDAWLTVRRHFFNDDPTNPMLPQSEHYNPPPPPPSTEFKVHG